MSDGSIGGDNCGEWARSGRMRRRIDIPLRHPRVLDQHHHRRRYPPVYSHSLIPTLTLIVDGTGFPCVC